MNLTIYYNIVFFRDLPLSIKAAWYHAVEDEDPGLF